MVKYTPPGCTNTLRYSRVTFLWIMLHRSTYTRAEVAERGSRRDSVAASWHLRERERERENDRQTESETEKGSERKRERRITDRGHFSWMVPVTSLIRDR